MAESTQPQEGKTLAASRRKTQIGYVVSTKMNKTIVVEVSRQKAHPMYRRVVAHTKKFYAHDEQNTAHTGDVVKIEETRPLSKLKRWRLVEVLRRAALVGPEAAAPVQAGQ
jgi:small subunit ribosomal protein S17